MHGQPLRPHQRGLTLWIEGEPEHPPLVLDWREAEQVRYLMWMLNMTFKSFRLPEFPPISDYCPEGGTTDFFTALLVATRSSSHSGRAADVDPDLLGAARAYAEECDEALRWAPEPELGIPEFKLTPGAGWLIRPGYSVWRDQRVYLVKLTPGGGWLIRPEEIRAALDKERSSPKPLTDVLDQPGGLPRKQWFEFVDYLGFGATLFGVRVC